MPTTDPDEAAIFAPPGPIMLGVSSCLLGEPVRHDGGHKRHDYVTGTLGRYFTFVAVCPEAAIGLGVPRPTIRLEGDPAQPRAVQPRTGADVTARLAAHGAAMADALGHLSGYIFKSKSPSCGMARVRVHPRPGAPPARAGAPARTGRGIYAQALLARLPLLPVEEVGRLGVAALRENFIERVFAYRRWQALLQAGPTAARLLRFHDRHRLALLAHGQVPARALERLADAAAAGAPAVRVQRYGAAFMALLARKATPRSHTRVLQHLAGRLQRQLDAADRAELLEVLEAYRLQRLPLIVPLTLLRHHFRRHPDPDVQGQTYLEPHPDELLLRNGV